MKEAGTDLFLFQSRNTIGRLMKTYLHRPIYNQFHNILRLLDVSPNFLFTTSETMGHYYLETQYVRVASRVASRVAERLKT